MAAPGKRDDQRRKGNSGPEKRIRRGKAFPETNTPRKNNPGGVGYETLHHLSSIGDEFRKAGMYQESNEHEDNLEERQLFEVKHEIKKLITELENSGLGDTNDEKKT